MIEVLVLIILMSVNMVVSIVVMLVIMRNVAAKPQCKLDIGNDRYEGGYDDVIRMVQDVYDRRRAGRIP